MSEVMNQENRLLEELKAQQALRRQARTITRLVVLSLALVGVVVLLLFRGGGRPATALAPAPPGAEAAFVPTHQPVGDRGQGEDHPRVSLTQTPSIPPGPDATAPLAGKVEGLSNPSEYRAIIYSHGNGLFWVQPFAADPFTPIDTDGSFHADVHGTEDTFHVIIVRYNDAAPPPPPPGKTATLDGIMPGVVARGSASKGVGQ
jgi:hypothetical protein